MTVDFAALLEASHRGEDFVPTRPEPVRGKWPKRGVTFDVERGDFIVPADVLARAEITGDDHEIRRAFAVNLAPHDEARPYRYVRGDGLRVYWRSIRVVKVRRER